MEVDTALDAALIVLESGGATNLAERTFNNVLKGFRQYGDAPDATVASVWRSDFVAVAVSTTRLPSATFLRRVGALGFALFRASEAMLLGERVARGEVAAASVAGEIDRIKSLAGPYNRWVVILAAACAAAFFTRTAGGDYGALGVALVAAAAGQFMRGLPPFRGVIRTVNISIAAIVSALIGTAGLRLGLSTAVPATLMGSIIYLIPGLSLANGFADLVSERHLLVGVERFLHAALVFLILTLALVIADALL